MLYLLNYSTNNFFSNFITSVIHVLPLLGTEISIPLYNNCLVFWGCLFYLVHEYFNCQQSFQRKNCVQMTTRMATLRKSRNNIQTESHIFTFSLKSLFSLILQVWQLLSLLDTLSPFWSQTSLILMIWLMIFRGRHGLIGYGIGLQIYIKNNILMMFK